MFVTVYCLWAVRVAGYSWPPTSQKVTDPTAVETGALKIRDTHHESSLVEVSDRSPQFLATWGLSPLAHGQGSDFFQETF